MVWVRCVTGCPVPSTFSWIVYKTRFSLSFILYTFTPLRCFVMNPPLHIMIYGHNLSFCKSLITGVKILWSFSYRLIWVSFVVFFSLLLSSVITLTSVYSLSLVFDHETLLFTLLSHLSVFLVLFPISFRFVNYNHYSLHCSDISYVYNFLFSPL